MHLTSLNLVRRKIPSVPYLRLSHQDPDIWKIFDFYTWTIKGQLLWGFECQGFRIGSNYGKYSRCKWFLGKVERIEKAATIKMHGAGLDAEASSDLKEGTEWACSKVDHLSTTISNTFATYIISIKQSHHHRHCVHQIVIEQGAVAWNNNQRLCYCGE